MMKQVLQLLAAFAIFLAIGAAATLAGIYLEPIKIVVQ